MSLLNKIIRYEVSDVSDEELINTVEVLEKSENVMAPSPSNIFRSTRFRHSLIAYTTSSYSCLERSSVKQGISSASISAGELNIIVSSTKPMLN